MNRRALTCIGSIFLFSIAGWTQANLDSLYSAWLDKNNSDSLRAQACRSYIVEQDLRSDPRAALLLIEELIKFSKEKGLVISEGKAYQYKGTALQFLGQYPEALKFYDKALEIYEIHDQERSMSGLLNNIALIYYGQGDLSRALDIHERSLVIRERTDDKRGLSNSYGNIGLIYEALGDNVKAISYFERSITVNPDDKWYRAMAMNSIANIWRGEGDLKAALRSYEECLALFEELDDIRGSALMLGNMAIIYKDQGDFEQALELNSRSLEQLEAIDASFDLGVGFTIQGNIYRAMKDFPKAKMNCERGLARARQVGELESQKDACKCLYELNKTLGNGTEALIYLEEMNVLQDSLDVEETSKKVQQMEFQKQMLADSLKNEEEKLKVEMVHQQVVSRKERSRNLFLGVGILLLVLAIGLYSRVRYVRRAKDRIEREKDRSENLLLNILPAEIAEELKQKGRADARDPTRKW